MLRDTRLRVTDVMDMRARSKSDEELLQRVPMLSRQDLEACRQWMAEHPRRGLRLSMWLRASVSTGAAAWVASAVYTGEAASLSWSALYFSLTFLAVWSSSAVITRQ